MEHATRDGQLTKEIERTREQLGETVRALAAKADLKATAKSIAKTDLTAAVQGIKDQIHKRASGVTAIIPKAAPARALQPAKKAAAAARRRRVPVAISVAGAGLAGLAIVWWRRR